MRVLTNAAAPDQSSALQLDKVIVICSINLHMLQTSFENTCCCSGVCFWWIYAPHLHSFHFERFCAGQARRAISGGRPAHARIQRVIDQQAEVPNLPASHDWSW